MLEEYRASDILLSEPSLRAYYQYTYIPPPELRIGGAVNMVTVLVRLNSLNLDWTQLGRSLDPLRLDPSLRP
jgi:hypothetical protein